MVANNPLRQTDGRGTVGSTCATSRTFRTFLRGVGFGTNIRSLLSRTFYPISNFSRRGPFFLVLTRDAEDSPVPKQVVQGAIAILCSD